MFRASLLALTLLVPAALLAGPAPARACDPCSSYKTVVCYERVTTYETKCVTVTYDVTCDECGPPYTVTKTCYREVRVPVTKVIAVVKRVKVCD
jgi:hypothetical protein